MRIALIGQAAFGATVLESLLKRGQEVVAVYTSSVLERALPLKELAGGRDIPLFQPKHMRDPEVHASLQRRAPDLAVMAFVTDIVPSRLLACPRLGTIQYHPSLLPRHRGSSAINWAIIQGDTETGLTIFWPDGGIDTGPILLQKKVEISPDDTVGSLYFNRLFPLGVEALMEAVDLVENGKAPRIPQDDSLATYEPPCDEGHSMIDWGKSSSQVYDLIRGTNPQPGAFTFWKGRKLRIFESEKLPLNREKDPGEVIEVSEEGLVVATAKGAIRMKRVQLEGAAKKPAGDLAREVGVGLGERLGN